MTITEQELTYIAEHWLPHQYLSRILYGESFTKANPEIYLAMKRGIPFTFNKFSTCIIFNDIYKYLFHSIYLEWTEFCGYTSYTEYWCAIKYNSELLREKITYLLQNNILSTERIYILE